MIEITSHRQGAILNRHHGEETSASLKVTVEGISETGRPVKINGVAAQMLPTASVNAAINANFSLFIFFLLSF